MHEAIPRYSSSMDGATDVAEKLNVRHGGLSEDTTVSPLRGTQDNS
jgi:hypothetical protein